MLSGSVLQGEHINNSNSTLQKLLALYVGSDLSDVTLVVGSKLYHVHKLILSMCSDVLKTMLTDIKWPEAFKDCIILSEEPECCDVFSDFIRYMYTGNIHLTGQSVLPVLTLADKYNVHDLSETCVTFMYDNCDAAADNLFVVSWLQYARLCSYKTLERCCLRYIEWNFQKVLNSTDFLSMRAETLIDFLHSSSLVVIDEYSLFEGVRRWLLYQKYNSFLSKPGFEKLLHKVLAHIRFSKFRPNQLQCFTQDSFMMDISQMLSDKLLVTPSSHKPVRECCSQQTLLGCMPRNYLCEDWSTQLIVENFTTFENHACRTLFFSTPATSCRSGSGMLDEDETSWDWQVDLYPKGIFFPRGILIGLQENFLLDEQEHKTVRIGVMAKCFHGNRHVEVCVLAIAQGQEKGSEFVKNIVRKKCIFDCDGCLCNIDNIVPYADMQDVNSSYLTGPDKNTFKIIIIIKPLTENVE